MAIISLLEILYIVIATLVTGYIFTGIFPLRGSNKDVLHSYTKGFDWSEFWFSCLVAAPGIILHEMGHKFVAMFLGLSAFFQVSYFGLFFGVLLKLFGSGFILLAPGYVVIFGASSWQGIITAFFCPFFYFFLLISSLFFFFKQKR